MTTFWLTLLLNALIIILAIYGKSDAHVFRLVILSAILIEAIFNPILCALLDKFGIQSISFLFLTTNVEGETQPNDAYRARRGIHTLYAVSAGCAFIFWVLLLYEPLLHYSFSIEGMKQFFQNSTENDASIFLVIDFFSIFIGFMSLIWIDEGKSMPFSSFKLNFCY